MTLAIWFLAAFGVSYVIGYAKISITLRELIAGIPKNYLFTSGGQPVPLSPMPLDPDVYSVDVTSPAKSSLVLEWDVPPLFGKGAFGQSAGHWIAALMECPACIGWWLGAAAVLSGLVMIPLDAPRAVTALLLAFATSAVNLLLAKWVGLT